VAGVNVAEEDRELVAYQGEGPEKSLRNGAKHGFLVQANVLPDTTGALVPEEMQNGLRAYVNWA
jgi:hypothetical protein